MPPALRHLEVVCAVIFDDARRVLAAQRPPGKNLGGKWEFPGGKVEPGENPEAALRREIREELCLAIEVLAALPAVVHDYPSFTIRLCPFEARIVAGTPAPTEHSVVQWIAPSAWRELDWAEADIPILQRLAQDDTATTPRARPK